MTQKLIENTLGVRREGVAESPDKLQKRGVIEYSRGRIMVLDRAGVEKSACECYQAVKREYARLLPRVKAT
jgi:Mn-dependent DtxR family transcriptional regulator